MCHCTWFWVFGPSFLKLSQHLSTCKTGIIQPVCGLDTRVRSHCEIRSRKLWITFHVSLYMILGYLSPFSPNCPNANYPKNRCNAIKASVCKQNWKSGDTKINFASFIPLQMTKFQKFWVPEYFQCTLLIKIQAKGKYCYFHFSFFFCSIIALNNLHLAINSERKLLISS